MKRACVGLRALASGEATFIPMNMGMMRERKSDFLTPFRSQACAAVHVLGSRGAAPVPCRASRPAGGLVGDDPAARPYHRPCRGSQRWCPMHIFVKNAPLDLTPQQEAAVSDRSGPPLCQGLLLTLISMVASDSCPEETLDRLSQVDADRWYLGQALESVLDQMERQQEKSAFRIGRTAYFMLTGKLKELGAVDAASFFQTLPSLWQIVARGDAGYFKAALHADNRALIEMAQPYNCDFEEGALVGVLDGLGYTRVTSQHTQCMRHGHSACQIWLEWT